MNYLDRLAPATLRVFAACLEHRRDRGEWPSHEDVVRRAEAEDASVGACLVLTRYELTAADGEVVPLGDCEDLHPPAIVRDTETVWAILMQGLPAAILKTPQGKTMRRQLLPQWASAWEETGEWLRRTS